jgi:hypothetical protein
MDVRLRPGESVAAGGGVILLGEPLTLRLLLAAILVLGGIALVLHEKPGRPRLRPLRRACPLANRNGDVGARVRCPFTGIAALTRHLATYSA